MGDTTGNTEEGTSSKQSATSSELYVKQLCDRSFLSLWSYLRVYRDQSKGARRTEGHELCDLLVIFENNYLIFSDKTCAFKPSKSVELSWSRWFRHAVEDSAKQIRGAERWLREQPERVFTHPECTKPIPIDLPDKSSAVFHRIIVARGISEACKAYYRGGSGSLRVSNDPCPRELGSLRMDQLTPFQVGDLDPSKGYVHILDDTSLDILLTNLDTATDFVAYLTRKEQFMRSGRFVSVAGEEELLAFYMRSWDEKGNHGFIVKGNFNGVALDEGFWEEWLASPQRRAYVEANWVSYGWDKMIESFNQQAAAGTLQIGSHNSTRDHERIMRFLAREPRVRRRMLSATIIELMRKVGPEQRVTRVIPPSHEGEPHYVFLLVPRMPGRPYDEYRHVRQEFLYACCLVTKLKFLEARDIIGYASEADAEENRSEDLIYCDARNWGEEQRQEAVVLQEKLGLLTNMTSVNRTYHEYPVSALSTRTPSAKPVFDHTGRNKPFPCGSGKKFKKCCGQ